MQYAVKVRRVYRDKVLSEIRGEQFEPPVRFKETKFADLVDMWLARNPNASHKDRHRFGFLKTFDFAQLTLNELKSLGNLSHVKSITGHQTLSQLQRYTHLVVKDVRAALNKTKRPNNACRK
jgi:hypothetical protein